jgi:hypothetical protein
MAEVVVLIFIEVLLVNVIFSSTLLLRVIYVRLHIMFDMVLYKST